MAKRVVVQSITRKITLRGVAGIMFDRYPGDNKTQLRPDQKMYFKTGTQQLVLPGLNIISFLCAQNTPSAAKVFLDSRKYKKQAQMILSSVALEPFEIPFQRSGKPIVFGTFGADGIDKMSRVYIHKSVARLKDGVPNPKERPVLPVPWSLSFALHYYPNEEVQEEQVQNLMVRGGLALGLGTFRGVFGKFEVIKWE